LSQYTRVTDGQTDGRTDGQTDRQTDRILIARPRLHFMQRGKNASLSFILVAHMLCLVNNNIVQLALK